MSQYYSNPERETDKYALPNVEVFYLDAADIRQQWLDNGFGADADEQELHDAGIPVSPGWYWWLCFPGCLPDSDPYGPFPTEQDALEDAREY